jgi:hypothetical protein
LIVVTDTETTQVTELVEKDIRTVSIVISSRIKTVKESLPMVSRDMGEAAQTSRDKNIQLLR